MRLTPSEDGTALIWNGGEKFSEYVAWLDYLVDTFLVPWGYTLSGAVLWQGEGEDDKGLIVVHNNRSLALKVTSARVALALAEAVDSEALSQLARSERITAMLRTVHCPQSSE